MSEQYVLITTISHFRMRYAIPVSALEGKTALNYKLEAQELVENQEVQEFSQAHISEDIIDTSIVSQEQLLQQFDVDNDYLRSWTHQKKIKHINNWKSKLD